MKNSGDLGGYLELHDAADILCGALAVTAVDGIRVHDHLINVGNLCLCSNPC